MTYAGGKQEEGVNKSLPERSEPSLAGRLALDHAKYRAMLSNDISKEQADAFLEALWEIMSAFVDLGWGLDPVQNILDLRGEFSSAHEARLIECEDGDLDEFLKNAASHIAADE